MRKILAALALATLIFAAPVAAYADDNYPPAPPTSTPVVVDPGGPRVAGTTASLPATGVSDAVLPIAAAGGLLGLLGAGMLVGRRLARR